MILRNFLGLITIISLFETADAQDDFSTTSSSAAFDQSAQPNEKNCHERNRKITEFWNPDLPDPKFSWGFYSKGHDREHPEYRKWDALRRRGISALNFGLSADLEDFKESGIDPRGLKFAFELDVFYKDVQALDSRGNPISPDRVIVFPNNDPQVLDENWGKPTSYFFEGPRADISHLHTSVSYVKSAPDGSTLLYRRQVDYLHITLHVYDRICPIKQRLSDGTEEEIPTATTSIIVPIRKQSKGATGHHINIALRDFFIDKEIQIGDKDALVQRLVKHIDYFIDTHDGAGMKILKGEINKAFIRYYTIHALQEYLAVNRPGLWEQAEALIAEYEAAVKRRTAEFGNLAIRQDRKERGLPPLPRVDQGPSPFLRSRNRFRWFERHWQQRKNIGFELEHDSPNWVVREEGFSTRDIYSLEGRLMLQQVDIQSIQTPTNLALESGIYIAIDPEGTAFKFFVP